MTARKSEALTNDDGLHDAITAGRAARGDGTASGQEALRRAGKQDVPKGKARGNQVKHDAPVPKADYLGKGNKPIGKQKESAVFVGNGQIDTGMVGSPSGPVPVSSVAGTPEEAKKLTDRRTKEISEQYKGLQKNKRVTPEQIQSMSAADLRAVAHDRGYKISDAAGGRGTRAVFTRLQEEDEFLED